MYLYGNLLLLLSTIILANSAWSDDLNNKTIDGIEYPSSEIFIDDKEHSRLVADCKEINDKSGNISCTFNEVIVLHKNTDSEEKTLSDVKKANGVEITKQINSIKEFCTDESEKDYQESFKLHPSLESQQLHVRLETFCHNPVKEELIKLYEDGLQIEKSACTIYSSTYTQEFEFKRSVNKWKNKNNDIDSSLIERGCGIIDVAYLEKDPRKGWDFAWNYRSRKIVTNASGKALGGQCSDLVKSENNVENEIISHGLGTLQYETNQMMDCKYIDFTQLI